MRSATRVLLCSAMLLAVSPAVGSAQTSDDAPFAKWGFRAGLGIDPDQFVFGGQVSLGRWTITRIVPSVDVGVGDDATTIDFNGDLFLRLSVPDASLVLYGGGGPTLAYTDRDTGGGNWDLGLSLVVGARLPLKTRQAFNLEARFGIGSIPEFRLVLGILF
jgi:hypothetical protein